MNFSQAYTKHGPDTMRIAKALGIDEPEADRLINEHMQKAEYRRRKAQERQRDIRLSLRAKEVSA